MNREQAFFLQILRDFINGLKTKAPDDLDWERIASYAKMHEVGGIVYHQCYGFIPVAFEPALEKSYSSAVFYYANREQAMKRVSNALKDVPFFAVKGLEVAHYYPIPMLRTMGDCDIVVEPKEFQAAIQALRKLGFEGGKDTDVNEWGCEYQGLHFELHDALVRDNEFANDGQTAFFNHFTPYIKQNHLDWNFHFLFLLMHLRKHFTRNGVGIRQFMDVAVLVNNGPALDWGWIEAKLEELNLKRFAHACYSIIEDWFGVSAPVEFARLSGEVIQIVTEIVFGNGVFGFDDSDNRDNLIRNELLHDSGPMWARRCAVLFKRTFPPYSAMKKYPGCEFLRGKKYLLPAAWIVRLAHILKAENNESRIRTVKSTFISRDDLDMRKDLFDELGLS